MYIGIGSLRFDQLVSWGRFERVSGDSFAVSCLNRVCVFVYVQIALT